MTPSIILLKPAEVARLLRLSTATLERWRHEGRGPAFTKLADRLIRYRQEDVMNWVQDQSTLDDGDLG